MNFDGTYPNGGLENGGVIRGDLLIDADAHITGNLLVDGDVTAENIISVGELKVEDAIILMGHNNAADTFNMGILEEYTNAGVQHSGLLRSAVDKKQYLIENISPIPTISTDLTLLNRGNLVVNGLESTTTTTDTVNFNQSDTGTVDWNLETDGNGLIFTPSSDIGQLRMGASGFTFGYRSDDSTGGFGMVINKSRGSITAPTAVISGDSLNEDYAAGYDGTDYGTGSVIKTIASENFTPTNRGSKVTFETTDIATTTPTEKLRLDTSGVTISNAYTLPDDVGNSGDVLVSDGLGNSEWEAQGGITSSTGLFSGGILSLGTGGPGVATTFSISSGIGQFVSGSTITPTTWVNYVDVSLSYPSGLTYISLAPPLTPGGVPVVTGRVPPLTAAQARDEIVIGVVSTQDNVTLLGFNSNPFFLGNHMSQFRDLCKSLGIINVSGNIIGPSISLLTITKTIGTIFSIHSNYSVDIDNPNISSIRAFDTNLVGDTYFWSFQDGSLAVHSDIRPAEYDDGNGVLSPGLVPSQKWTNMRVYVAIDRIIVAPGQTLYNSQSEAQSMIFIETHNTPVELNDVAVLVGVIVVRGGALNLNFEADAHFVQITAGGGSGSGSTFDQDLNTTSDVQFASVKTESVNIEGAAELISNFETGEWDFSNNTVGVTSLSATSCQFDELDIGKRAISSLYSFKPGDISVGGFVESKYTLSSISTSIYVALGYSFPSCETVYAGHATGFGSSESYHLALGFGGAGNVMVGDGIVLHDPTSPTILVANGDFVSVKLTRTTSVLWTLSYALGSSPTAIVQTTTIGPEFQNLDCHAYSGVFGESSASGFVINTPVITHSLWTPSVTNVIQQMDTNNNLELIGRGSVSLVDPMIVYTPQAIEIKNNLQVDSKITSQKSLFGYPVASDVCFYVSTAGTEFAANDASPFELHIGQRIFGSANVPKFNEGSYLKISMRGTLNITTSTDADLILKCYVGTSLICSSDTGDGELRPNSRDWFLDIDIYPKTFSIVDFESVTVYAAGMFQTHWSNASNQDVVKGFGLVNTNQTITPADLGDLRITAEWNGTTSANDNLTMETCRFEYGGFST